MKVMFVLDNYSKYFSIDDIVRLLYHKGHEITIIMGIDKKRNVPDDAIKKAKSDLPEIIIEPLLKRRYWRMLTKNVRELSNYAYILNNEATRQWDAAKWSRFFHPFLWNLIKSENGKKIIKNPSFQRRLRSINQKIPVDSHIKAQIKKRNPDIVIISPLVNANSKENEYVDASQALGIPCVYSMYSWDNIASKGTLHNLPDYSLVWNKPLALELEQLHNIPKDRIFVTGAPRFDRLIDRGNEYILARDEFCNTTGLDAMVRYVLYVCSTFLVNSEYKKELNEAELILEIAEAFQKDPRTKDIKILVRPHPTNAGIVKNLLDKSMPNISVYPINGELPDTEQKRAMFYNSIYHSRAVVGVNTTAFLEASALDRPCITILTEKFRETQKLPHFHHLADANFMETADGMTELVEITGKILDGIDDHSRQRHEFVNNFLRPLGMNKPASEVYADLVEKIATNKSNSK